MTDVSAISGYALSGAFGLFGVIQIATEDLTGIGMLAIAGFSAWSTHVAKRKKAEYDAQVAVIRAESESREKALETRVKLILAGHKCDHHECPIVGSLPPDFPFDRKETASPEEDTVDVQ